jgi:hypothetical protein
MTDHYRSCMRFPICNKQTKIVPPTSYAEIIGLKPYNLNDILCILKKLEYTLTIIPHLARVLLHLSPTYMSFGRMCSTYAQC